ncbi:MAG TPA: class I SAM-dependent methyltransferase [Solirubrobacteraceae bacterium]|nr:class I SAM-dependent methyltransferase [Solirubrobacteraceae bacterium]
MSDIPAIDRVLPAAIPLLGAAEAASALGATLRLRLDGTTVAPEFSAQLDAVLGALGIGDAVDALDADESVAVLGIVEGFLQQAADFVAHPSRSTWDHEDPSILRAQGHTSALIPPAVKRFVLPALGDALVTRMDSPDAAFLDVGVGVGALAVAMCQLWPSLRTVGIDPWEPALALAREQVAAAGLEERIELRKITAEALEDREQFDLAWVPTFFIPSDVLDPAIERVHAALRPDGWVLLGMYGRPGNPFIDALADFRAVRQGGSLRTPQEVASSLERAGFEDVAVHFNPEWGLPLVYVAGRRAPAT